MAAYNSKKQKSIDQRINLEFSMDVQGAARLAQQSKRSAAETKAGIEQINAAMAKVRAEMVVASKLRGKNKKTQEEQISFNAKKEAQLKKLNAQYAALNKNLLLIEKTQQRSTLSGGFGVGVRGGSSNSVIGGIGNATGTLLRYAAGAALISGLYAVAEGFKTAIKWGVEFEAQLAQLAAITGISRKEAEELGNAAFDLAGKTKFTVQEIVELQQSLAKLGFDKKEIIEMQEAVASLAAATGEDLGKAAELTGKLIRAFSLEATSATRVSNILQGTINNSAATLESLGTALQYVSPIAAQFGLTLEETNAAVATLLNQGFTASRAGTGLRQILLETQKAGESLADTMTRLKKEGLTATRAVELVGKRGAPALLALVNNVEVLEDLTGKVAENFTAIVAESKTLTTTSAAFNNLGVAIKTAVTEASLLGRFLRDIGVSGLDLFDEEAGAKVAFSEVVAGLTPEDLETITEAEEDAGKIAQVFFARMIALRNEGVLSFDEFVAANQGDAFGKAVEDFLKQNRDTAIRLKAAQDVLNTIEERSLLPSVSDVDSAARNQGSGIAKDLINQGVDYAGEVIAQLEKERTAAVTDEQKLRINALLEAWNSYVTQLISIDTAYAKYYEGLSNKDLDSEKERLEVEKERLETALKLNKAKGGDATRAAVKELDEINNQIDAATEELTRRGLDDKGEDDKEQKLFKAIADAEFELNKLRELQAAGEAVDLRRIEQLEKFTAKELKALGNLTEGYEAYREAYSRTKIEQGLGFAPVDDSGILARAQGINATGKSGSGLGNKIANAKSALEEIKALQDLVSDPKAKDRLNQIQIGLEKTIADGELQITKRRNKLIQDLGVETANIAFNALQGRFESELMAIEARYSAEEDILQSSLDNQLITQEQYEVQREALEKKKIDEQNRIRKKQFNADKAQSLIEVGINTAVGVSSLLKEGLKGTALFPLMLGLGAVQAAAIAATKYQPIQYAEGGYVNGPSHSAGGVPFSVQGQGGYEMEGGEFIINKTAMSNPLVAQTAEMLNDMGNKRSVVTGMRGVYADGGQVPNAQIDAIAAAASQPVEAFVSEREQMERANVRVRTDRRSTL